MEVALSSYRTEWEFKIKTEECAEGKSNEIW